MRQPAFRFVISEVFGSIAGFEGPILAGPVLDASGQFKVGDWLEISTESGQIRIQCAGFPLVNWGRPDWVTISVLGLPSSIDVHGLTAETPVSDP